jgi:hypothetical protein
MTCDLARPAIVEAQTGNLGDAELRELHAHLVSCPSCSAEAQTLRSWWDGLDAYAAPPMSPAVRQRFMESLVTGAPVGSVRSQPTRRRLVRTALYAATALAGWGIGRFGAPATTPDAATQSAPLQNTATRVASAVPPAPGAQYLLLVLGEGSRVNRTAAEEQAVVSEYRNWAIGLAREGKLVSAEKLTDDAGLVLGNAALEQREVGNERVTGFFVFRARDLAEARRIAGDCPHIRRGGRVELRAIEGT